MTSIKWRNKGCRRKAEALEQGAVFVLIIPESYQPEKIVKSQFYATPTSNKLILQLESNQNFL